MSSKRLLDPQLVPMLERMPQLDFSAAGLLQTRATMEAMTAAAPKPDVPVDVEARQATGFEGGPDVPVFVYRPRNAVGPLPALLQIHGGGYVGGSAALSDVWSRTAAHALECLVVSVDYRLAPETPYPGPVEDCYAAYIWLCEQARALNVDLKRLAIAGDSAGGGLAAGLALLIRDRGAPAPVIQVLTYPMIDDRTASTRQPSPSAGGFVWTPEYQRFGWRSYLGREPGGEDTPHYAAAARAETLRGLPPTFIGVGALDLFVDENLDYARRLIADDVPTEIHVYPGAFHGFDAMPEAASATAYRQARLDALRRAFTAPAHGTDG